jgi:bifunctional DNA-binding transcriptional regulator/antitoxin component of YhaV-PrlF toxin-antitoxin module
MDSSKYFLSRVEFGNQITLPGEICKQLDLVEGDKVVFFINSQNQAVFVKLPADHLSQNELYVESLQLGEKEGVEQESARLTFDTQEDFFQSLEDGTN